jgi:hypothetical protein
MDNHIIPEDFIGSHLTHMLPPDMSEALISSRLGFDPKPGIDGDKLQWEGRINGQAFAIWDHKGARWSVYLSHWAMEPMKKLFPEIYP